MRHRYLVCYDIADPKRLRRVFKTMKGFGDPLQESVFSCDLSPAERVMLIEALTAIINKREDSVIILNSGPVGSKHRPLEYIGRPVDQRLGQEVVII
jgi:CRISPR-associated protein Cas2